ncbi:MAG TPA: M48 family metalloprotease [Steroidobacteraceae bacterium]|nr:M48 family metalloprotease [Steroidobacteraceae bacterium]
MARLSPHLAVALLAGTFALAGGCATNPVTGGKDIVTMSEEQEIELGRKMHPQVLQEYGRYDDEILQQYVNAVGQRIATSSHRPSLQYTFTVLDSADVNAFALPGGYVYVTRGIMAYLNSEAELAAVLGHEIGHVTARHSVRQQTGATAAGVGAMVVGILTGSPDLANVASTAGTALVRGYGRDMELEADKLGAEYLNRIGYEPEEMIDVVRLLKNQEMLEVQMARQENRKPRVYHGVFSTHPDNDTRLKEVVRAAAKVQNTEERPDNRDAYLARLDGMPMGDSRAQGIVRGSRFYHGDLGFTLAFPSGWVVENQQSSVLAYPESKDAMIKVSAAAPPPGVGPKEFLGRLLKGATTTASAPLEVNGLQGYTATVRSTGLPWGNQGPARVAVVYYNNLAYVFQGAPRQAAGLSSFDPVFNSSVKTFRRLRDNEFPQAEPDKIRVMRATQGTTIEQLARNSPIKKYPIERLRLLNDLYPDKQPVVGQRLKIVE